MKNNTKLIVETWRRYLKEGDDNPKYHDPELENIEQMAQSPSDPDLDPNSEEVELPSENVNSEMTPKEVDPRKYFDV